MYKTITILIFFLAAATLHAQEKKINLKAQKAYDAAMMQLNDGLTKDAIPLLGKAIEYQPDFTEAYLSMAGVYGELKDYTKALQYYDAARKLDNAGFSFYLLPYSINLAGLGKFDEALAAINTFLAIPNLPDRSIKSGTYRKRTYEFAIAYLQVHPAGNYVFNPVNLGDSINSKEYEYLPSFTIDDSILVFTRRNADGITEDFIMSRRTAHGYSEATLINGRLNEEMKKGAINISQDGEWLVFAGNFPQAGFGNFDIYLSYNTPDGWSVPVNLGENINTEYWESSPSLSADKNSLYFSSDRPGGYGGIDIYVSHRAANGKWGPAQNMGPLVNTKGNEQAPFIHADNNTLYYTSDGLPGYGGTDLYMIKKDSSGNWGYPQNLGYPINTIENEGSLFVSADGTTGYYASDRADSRGKLDLYSFQMRTDIRPTKTLYVEGNVFDAATKKNIPCAVELTDNATQKIISSVQTDETGFYFITLPTGKDYTFTVNRRGYLFYSDIFSLSQKEADSTYIKDIPLQPITLNATGVLKNIQFATNTATLENVSLIELNKLLQLMNENTSVKVQINGHTDNTGNSVVNQKLSLDRAKAVAAYLISKGISPARLTYKGFGATMPIAANNSEEGRAVNRRTEFVITGL